MIDCHRLWKFDSFENFDLTNHWFAWCAAVDRLFDLKSQQNFADTLAY